jgi:hypothetical protein
MEAAVKVKGRMEITLETEELFVISRPRRFHPIWCPKCGDQVEMVTAGEAAAFAGFSLRTICRLVESDKLHFTEMSDGLLFICLNSIPRCP